MYLLFELQVPFALLWRRLISVGPVLGLPGFGR